MTENHRALISKAVQEIAAGKMIILSDDPDRENEGDLVVAGQFCTPESINFMITHGRGLVCVPMSSGIANDFGLKKMVSDESNASKFFTNFTISVGARDGVTTGISAFDRARTVNVLANPTSTKNDIVSPGHIFPLVAVDGGVMTRQGHTEASIEICKLAGLRPVAVVCEILKADGTMAKDRDLNEFSAIFGINRYYISDLVRYVSAM